MQRIIMPKKSFPGQTLCAGITCANPADTETCCQLLAKCISFTCPEGYLTKDPMPEHSTRAGATCENPNDTDTWCDLPQNCSDCICPQVFYQRMSCLTMQPVSGSGFKIQPMLVPVALLTLLRSRHQHHPQSVLPFRAPMATSQRNPCQMVHSVRGTNVKIRQILERVANPWQNAFLSLALMVTC